MSELVIRSALDRHGRIGTAVAVTEPDKEWRCICCGDVVVCGSDPQCPGGPNEPFSTLALSTTTFSVPEELAGILAAGRMLGRPHAACRGPDWPLRHELTPARLPSLATLEIHTTVDQRLRIGTVVYAPAYEFAWECICCNGRKVCGHDPTCDDAPRHVVWAQRLVLAFEEREDLRELFDQVQRVEIGGRKECEAARFPPGGDPFASASGGVSA